jgi:hypothetical protein
MTPTFVPETFERVMGCTASELQSWLPRALPGASLAIDARAASCTARWPGGVLKLDWEPRPSRRIALLEIPCLAVRFSYGGFSDEARYRVQQQFDLQTHRGGG